MDKNHPGLVHLPPGSPGLLLPLAQLPEMLLQLRDKQGRKGWKSFWIHNKFKPCISL